MDLAVVIEQGSGERHEIKTGTLGRSGRLGENVTMKQSQRGRLKNFTPSSEDLQVAT